MISGIFDQFLFKQILSLDSEVIQWLGNDLNNSISFVLFFHHMKFLMPKKYDSLKQAAERYCSDDKIGRQQNLRSSKRCFTIMICCWIWLLFHAAPHRLRGIKITKENLVYKSSWKKSNIHRKSWLSYNKTITFLIYGKNGNSSINAIYPVCSWRTVSQSKKLKGRKSYSEKKFKGYCSLKQLMTFRIQGITY